MLSKLEEIEEYAEKMIHTDNAMLANARGANLRVKL